MNDNKNEKKPITKNTQKQALEKLMALYKNIQNSNDIIANKIRDEIEYSRSDFILKDFQNKEKMNDIKRYGASLSDLLHLITNLEKGCDLLGEVQKEEYFIKHPLYTLADKKDKTDVVWTFEKQKQQLEDARLFVLRVMESYPEIRYYEENMVGHLNRKKMDILMGAALKSVNSSLEGIFREQSGEARMFLTIAESSPFMDKINMWRLGLFLAFSAVRNTYLFSSFGKLNSLDTFIQREKTIKLLEFTSIVVGLDLLISTWGASLMNGFRNMKKKLVGNFFKERSVQCIYCVVIIVVYKL